MVRARCASSVLPPGLTTHAACEALSSLFRGTVCEELARGPTRHVLAGERLYHIGGAARSVFLLRRGLVKTSVVSTRGQELTLRVYAAGDILGELCLCLGERREQAIALEPSEVIEVPVERLTARLRRDPDAALQFAETLCERLAEAHERLHSLAVDPVLGRLVRTLLALAADLGEPTAQGTQISHHFPQEELARLVGARREVISSLLNRLRASGLITYARGHFILVDLERLIALRDYLDADEPRARTLTAG
jgi:CRP-like cAMP-binding protein